MKILLLYSIFSLVASVPVFGNGLDTGEWSAATNYLQMSISLDSDNGKIQTNHPCILLIRYKNISTNETFWVYESSEYNPDYSIIVIAPSGKDISPDMKLIKRSDSGSVLHAAPQKTVEIKFDLSKLCSFNDVGTYKVIVKNKDMFAYERRKTFTVVSNPLLISVVSNK